MIRDIHIPITIPSIYHHPRVKIGENPLQRSILHRSCATSFITIHSSRESAITSEEELAESRKTCSKAHT